MAKVKLSTQKLKASIESDKKKLAVKEAELKARLSDLNKDSPDMQALLVALQKAAESNNVSVSDVIMSVAKIKKTGLKIEKATRKPKTKKIT